ncbi:MAG: zinc ribbon domain-containing protein [Euryarchaeota archaeon]|nr:zinc ribbon domain-containing protein [Euryarchaeota archaeon]
MSEKLGSGTHKRALCLLIACTMVLPGALGILAPFVGSKAPGKPVVTGFGDIDVNGTILPISDSSPGVVFNSKGIAIFTVDGNITVRNGGQLILRNVNIDFLQDVNNVYKFTVDNQSTLTMSNATITTNYTQLSAYIPLAMYVNDSTLKMENYSVLAFPGALEVRNSTVYVNDSWITGQDPTNAFATTGEFDDWTSNFYTVIPTNVNGYLSTLDPAQADTLNDGPKLYFERCNNTTFGNSRIDMLYEDANYQRTGTVTSIYPSARGPTDNSVGSLTNLQNANDSLYVVVPSLFNVLNISNFDTSSLNPSMTITSATLVVVYNTTTYGRTPSGPGDESTLNWSTLGGSYQVAFILDNYSLFSINTTNLFGAGVNTLGELGSISLRFEDMDNNGDPVPSVNFDMIEIIVTQVPPFDYTAINFNDCEASFFNTYTSIDFVNETKNLLPGRHNAFNLTTGSHVYLYNDTIDLDDNNVAGPDYLEGNATSPVAPFDFLDAASEAYIYRLVDTPVIDGWNNPVTNATVNATLDHINPTAVQYVSNLNDLGAGATVDNLSADARALAYLNRTQDRYIFGGNYTSTNNYGKTLLPLISDVINPSTLPNGQYFGNYMFNASYWNGTGWNNASAKRSLLAFPDMTAEANAFELVDSISGAPILKLSNYYPLKPDLTIESTNITFTPLVPPNVNEREEYQTNVKIANVGNTTAVNFNVTLTVFYQGIVNWTYTWGVDALKGGDNRTLTVVATAWNGGRHTYQVVVDPDNKINEDFRGNNTNSTFLDIIPDRPELSIVQAGINFYPTTVPVGMPVAVNATVYNTGTSNATGVEVRFYNQNPDVLGDGLPDAGVFPVGTSSLDVNIYAPNTTSIVYIPDVYGNMTIYVWIDPVNVIPEREDDIYNNTANRSFTVTPQPNLEVMYINLSDETPMENTSVMIAANVNNTGGTDVTTNFTVTLYLDSIAYVINTAVVNGLGANNNTTIFLNYTFTSHGYHTIIAEVDTNGAVTESDETDNTITKQIVVYYLVTDLIVNSTNGPGNPRIIDTPIVVPGFVLVEGTGVLIVRSDLKISQASANQHTFVVRNTGNVTLANGQISTDGYSLTMTLSDSAVLYANGVQMPSTLNIEASGTSRAYFEGATIGGYFDFAEGSSVRMLAGNSTFSRPMFNVRGNANLTFVASYVPLLTSYDTSNITIYRWLTVNVADGVDPGYPVQGASVNVTSGLDNVSLATAFTDASGQAQFMLMSDVINPLIYPNSYFVGNYKVLVGYTSGPFTSLGAFEGLTLAQYPSMSDGDNRPGLVIRLGDVLPDLDPPVWASNANPGRGQSVTITTVVNNTGVADAYSVLIYIRDSTTSEIIKAEVAPFIAKNGGSYWINATTSFNDISDIGAHNITVEVDPYNQIPEMNNSNNVGWTIITVRGLPDIEIGSIGVSPLTRVVNSTASVIIQVNNIGDVPTGSFDMRTYVRSASLAINDTVLLNTTTIGSIPAGAYVTVNVSWLPGLPGTYDVIVDADPTNAVAEFNKTNNNVTATGINVLDYASLYISTISFSPAGPVSNRTFVTVAATVHNTGEMVANNIVVTFYDGSVANPPIGTATISRLPTFAGSIIATASIDWFATCTGRSENHTIIATVSYDPNEAPGTPVSHVAQTYIVVVDPRPDLVVSASGITVLNADYTAAANVTEGSTFNVNVTVFNNGTDPALNFTVEVFNDTVSDLALMGNFTVSNLTGGSNVTVRIACRALSGQGSHPIFAVIDREMNLTDGKTGSVEEPNEANNAANKTLLVVGPLVDIVIISPSSGFTLILKSSDNFIVDGRILSRADSTGVANVQVTIELLLDGSVVGSVIATSGSDGYFITSSQPLPAPAVTGMYYVRATANGAPESLVSFNVLPEPQKPLDWWWYAIIIAIIVGAVIGGITAYYYFVGVGKMVECGECGAFIPEGSTKCPKCGVEFEGETAKCSVCGAWVPMSAKQCTECGTAFTTGEEIVEEYEVTMRRQYDELVNKIKFEASQKGVNDAEFKAWWPRQPTYITFDQWLREEEEMKKTGSAPCPNCGTPNSVTGRVCHKCGTVLDAAKPKGKMPPPAAAAAPVAAAAAQPPATAPKELKRCPDCGMNIDSREKVCPVCGHDFEKGAPAQAQRQPVQQQPGQQGQPMEPRRVVKKIVRKPMAPGQQPEAAEEKKEGGQ